jgi:pimeloyl-ACP methyl ester carboxylesterase
MVAQSAEFLTTQRGFFFVGIERSTQPFGTVPRGQMYVQWECPLEQKHPYPIVMIHGGGGQGTDWLGAPDGRPGWATMFLREGYKVYVVDRPGHGRSQRHPDVLGPMSSPMSYELVMSLFARGTGAVSPFANPFAHLNTQWPGSGAIGDPALDQLIASQGSMLVDMAEAHRLEQRAGAELLDRIGPAILMTHSAGGPFGWVVADARPKAVKAIIAVEPLGPPFMKMPQMGVGLPWGISAMPLTFDPPCEQLSELKTVTRDNPGGPPVTLQAEPARRLPNLSGFPIAVVTAEASPIRLSDPATVAFLRQGGCDAEELRLAEHGVHGNGHLMMGELNNEAVARVLFRWLDERVHARAR